MACQHEEDWAAPDPNQHDICVVSAGPSLDELQSRLEVMSIVKCTVCFC